MKKQVKKNTTQKEKSVKGLTLYTFDDVVSAFYQGLLRGGQAVIYLHDAEKKEFSVQAINETLKEFSQSAETLKNLSMMPLREYLLYVDSITKK